MSSLCLNDKFRLPENKYDCISLDITSENVISSRVTLQNAPRFLMLSVLVALSSGLYACVAILKAEKVLGPRLRLRRVVELPK